MTIPQIIKFKKKSWLRLCTLHDIDKWELIRYINEPVYPSRFLIDPQLCVSTDRCRICSVVLDLGIHHGIFIVKRQCKCNTDGTQLMTYEKLSCVLPESQINYALRSVYDSRCTGLPNTRRYWETRGIFDDALIKERISEIQLHRSKKSPASKKGNRGYSCRSIATWTSRGLDEANAILKVRKIQVTNGLSYYLDKHGEHGKQLYEKRISSWLSAPGNRAMCSNRSKISLSLFDVIGIGNYGRNEMVLHGSTKIHRVDFNYGNKIIEFYGDYWHANPSRYAPSALIRKKTAESIWNNDKLKIDDLQNNGYRVMIVWESDFIKNPMKIIEQCKDFINNDDQY